MTTNEKMTQNRLILRALKAGRRLTSYMGFSEFRCVKFTNRIGELRKMGYKILDRQVKAENSNKHWNEYWMEEA